MEKIFKKSLALVLSAALCLTALVGCLTVSAAETDNSATVTVGSVTVNSDATTATVPVAIKASGDGIAAAMFELKVDTTKIYLSGSWADVAKVTKTGSNSIGINVSASHDGDNVTTVASEGVYRFIVEGFDPNGNKDVSIKQFTDVSFDLTFNIASGATGENAIEFVNDKHAQACNAGTFNADGTYTGNEKPFALTGTNGAVIVKDDTVYEDPNLKIRSAGITIANGFALNFKVRKTMETSLGYTDTYLVFQKPRYDIEGNLTDTITTTVTADLRTEDSTNSENYVYTLSGIQPQELGTEVTATIYGTKDGHVYTGATVTYSVLKFATNQIKSTKTDKKTNNLKIACADMINFAGAIQRYGKYNTANPIEDKATELLGSDSWKSLATESITRELVNAQKNTQLDGATVRIRSAGIIFEDKVVLYFNCADLGVKTLANPENYYLHATYNSVTGEANEFDLEIGSNYQAKLDTLYSTELGTVVTVYMIDKATGAQVSNTIEYSIETFIKNNLTNANHGECCETLCKYGDSVRKYAGLD